MSSRVIGLSGAGHEAWAELPPQKVRVSQIDFNDRAFAVLTLDDGRKLRVALTGNIDEDASNADRTLIPCITIDVEESLAGLDAAGIRERLELLPDAVCWRSHWDDDHLRREAEGKARWQAIEDLDWPADDIDLPPGLSPQLRRETLLHYEVKRILEGAGQISVPGFEIVEELKAEGLPTLRREFTRDVSILELTNTRLETRVGQTVPDVVTEAWADGGQSGAPLLIEVTVTNHIDEERQQRIEALDMAALEIDLSLAGGRVTRSGLHHLVVHDVSLKRWLVHPEMGKVRRELQAELQTEMEVRKEIVRLNEERRARVMAEPLAEVVQRYVAAAEDMFIAGENESAASKVEFEAARHAVAASVEEMRWRGFPEAGNEDLLGHHRILSRILSIKRDTGIGYRYSSGFEVLNAIRQSGDLYASEWTIYLIAAKVYAPTLSDGQRLWLDQWREKVTQAIHDINFTVMRDDSYDRLLSVAFPEMAEGLAKNFGKRPRVPNVVWSEKNRRFERTFQQPRHGKASFLSRHGSGWPSDQDHNGDLSSWLLRGQALEAWKKANPESAKAWESVLEKLNRTK